MKLISHYFPFFLLTVLLYGLFFYAYQQPTIIAPKLNSGQQAVQLQFIEFTPKTEAATADIEAHEKEVQAVKAKPATEKPKIALSDNSKIKIAKQKLQEAIQATAAADDAQLKAELYNPEHKQKALSATPKQAPEIKKQLPKEIQSSEIKQQEKPVIKKQPSASSSVKKQGVLQEAIVVSGNIPVYPKRAILRNQQGRVVVKLTVSSQGEGRNPHIIASSGYSILDNAVIAFIRKELFMPALQGDKKVTSEQIFSFRFELH